MSTTKRSNFAAGLRTTILLAGLTGLFVVIGFAIGCAQTALLFLFFGALYLPWVVADFIRARTSAPRLPA